MINLDYFVVIFKLLWSSRCFEKVTFFFEISRLFIMSFHLFKSNSLILCILASVMTFARLLSNFILTATTEIMFLQPIYTYVGISNLVIPLPKQNNYPVLCLDTPLRCAIMEIRFRFISSSIVYYLQNQFSFNIGMKIRNTLFSYYFSFEPE